MMTSQYSCLGPIPEHSLITCPFPPLNSCLEYFVCICCQSTYTLLIKVSSEMCTLNVSLFTHFGIHYLLAIYTSYSCIHALFANIHIHKEKITLHLFCLQFDLGGSLPPIIINRVLKRQPLTIHYLRQHLMRNHEAETLTRWHIHPNTRENSHHDPSRNSVPSGLYEESMPVGEFISPKQRRSVTRPHRKRREKQQGDYHVLISSDSV